MALMPDLLAAPGKGVMGIAPVVCTLGAEAEAAVEEPLAAAVEETLAAAGVVARVVAGRAALLEDTLTGTGLRTTVDAALATTVVAALEGPMMTTEGRGVVVLLLRSSVTVMRVVVVKVETVVGPVC